MSILIFLVIIWVFICVSILCISIINLLSLKQLTDRVNTISPTTDKTILEEILPYWDIILSSILVLIYIVSIIFKNQVYHNNIWVILFIGLLLLIINPTIVVIWRLRNKL